MKITKITETVTEETFKLSLSWNELSALTHLLEYYTPAFESDENIRKEFIRCSQKII